MPLPSHITIHPTALPDATGVYIMKDKNQHIIYVGKASSLKNRVASYFHKAHDRKTEALVSEIASIDYKTTDSILEATFLEAQLIKQHLPKYNIKDKDDRSFVYIVFTKNLYPKILLTRGKELKETGSEKFKAVFGPFMSAHIARSILKLTRKIIPFSNCEPPLPSWKTSAKPCFYYHLGQCPGICIGAINYKDYQKRIRNLVLFFQGKRKAVLRNFKKEMERLSKLERFEEAASIRNQLSQLEHLQDSILIQREPTATAFDRIEGYDVSNISGTSATGSMVVFENGEPNKDEYRRFRIKRQVGANDVAMLKEILLRRFHNIWKHPNLILIDGGRAQVNTALNVLQSLKLSIPTVGIAKGPTRKKVELVYGKMPQELKSQLESQKGLLIMVRDEAHRFAVSYHRLLRTKRSFALKG